jgi:agmatinase
MTTDERAPNFGDLPEEYSGYETARVVVLPVPFDLTSTWQKGADLGPAALIEASANMELYDIETDSEVYTRGIHTAPPVTADSTQSMVAEVEARAARYLGDGKFVVTLGGEHSVSLGAIRAHLARHPRASVLHLDAHSDRRPEYHGDPLSHASVMGRVEELTKETVSVGIRSMDADERPRIRPGRVFFAHDLEEGTGWVSHVIGLLQPEVYITLDLDVFDPGIMPSTGTPEPGGLSWRQVTTLINTIVRERTLIGFDVVELCPSEADKAPDFLAAKLVYQTLSRLFSRST